MGFLQNITRTAQGDKGLGVKDTRNRVLSYSRHRDLQQMHYISWATKIVLESYVNIHDVAVDLIRVYPKPGKDEARHIFRIWDFKFTQRFVFSKD